MEEESTKVFCARDLRLASRSRDAFVDVVADLATPLFPSTVMGIPALLAAVGGVESADVGDNAVVADVSIVDELPLEGSQFSSGHCMRTRLGPRERLLSLPPCFLALHPSWHPSAVPSGLSPPVALSFRRIDVVVAMVVRLDEAADELCVFSFVDPPRRIAPSSATVPAAVGLISSTDRFCSSCSDSMTCREIREPPEMNDDVVTKPAASVLALLFVCVPVDFHGVYFSSPDAVLTTD